MPKFSNKFTAFVGLIVALELIFPQYSYVYAYADIGGSQDNPSLLAISSLREPIIFGIGEAEKLEKLPLAGNREPRKTIKVIATAYSSTVDQTDSDPFTTANGSRVRDGIVAANFLPFGTKIKLPQIAGNKVFSVEDRMNPRFDKRIDIWFETREEAKKFGVKYVEVEIY